MMLSTDEAAERASESGTMTGLISHHGIPSHLSNAVIQVTICAMTMDSRFVFGVIEKYSLSRLARLII